MAGCDLPPGVDTDWQFSRLCPLLLQARGDPYSVPRWGAGGDWTRRPYNAGGPTQRRTRLGPSADLAYGCRLPKENARL